jgi:Ca-activated chloride channel family protein
MIESIAEGLSNLHFLRPFWFAGLLPAAILLVYFGWRKRNVGNWHNIINPALLPFLIEDKDTEKGRKAQWNLGFLALSWVLCCLSLAGPTWQQLPQPVHKQDSVLVVILDLSPSMLGEDVTPSRLVRARYKLIDILTQRNEGVVGLVVYGGNAHTVSPLTDDTNTIITTVPVLAPSLLPVYGSNVEDAVTSAIDLIVSGGYSDADILLITDGVDLSAFSDISAMLSQQSSNRLSILGVGTAQGAPIPTGAGGFAKQANGNMIIAKLNINALQSLARDNGGIYRTITPDDSDVTAIINAMDQLFDKNTRETERSFDLWDDQGYWLIILLLPILLLNFRKGSLATILLLPMVFTHQPAQTYEWIDLWQTPNQQAAKLLDSGDSSGAQTLFDDPKWRASAAYKANNFDQASADFYTDDTATGHYNRGNALAKAGKLDDAIEAYDSALALEPNMEDAIANKSLVSQLKEQQQEQQEQNQDQQSQDQQNQDQQNQDQQNQDQQNQDQQSQDQQSQDQQNQDQQSQDQQNQDQQSQDQQSQDQQNQDQQSQDQQSQDQQNQDQQSQDQQSQDQQSQDQQSQDQPSPDTQDSMQTETNNALTEEEKQEQQAIEKMLRRVPDDPGGLLRAKFRYQSRLQQNNRPPPTQERW